MLEIRITHYNTAAILAICFSLSLKVSSLRAVCILYFSCRSISDSAGIPKAVSKTRAEGGGDGSSTIQYFIEHRVAAHTDRFYKFALGDIAGFQLVLDHCPYG